MAVAKTTENVCAHLELVICFIYTLVLSDNYINPKVHAGGSGLERGVQGQPTDFNVWTREAGHGSLAISVEGPSKAIVDFKV